MVYIIIPIIIADTYILTMIFISIFLNHNILYIVITNITPILLIRKLRLRKIRYLEVTQCMTSRRGISMQVESMGPVTRLLG